MRLRASSSSNSAARAGAAARPRRGRAPRRARGRRRSGASLADVEDFDAAVLRPRGSRRGRRPWAFPCRSSPSRSGFPCAPRSCISFFTASARFWPSAMLYSRLPRSSAWPWSVTRALPVRLQVLRVGVDHRAELVLDDEAVVVEVDGALRQHAPRILERAHRPPARRAADAGGSGAAGRRARRRGVGCDGGLCRRSARRLGFGALAADDERRDECHDDPFAHACLLKGWPLTPPARSTRQRAPCGFS